MIIFKKRPGDPPWPPVTIVSEDDDSVSVPGEARTSDSMAKKSFVPAKPIVLPLPGENLVSYGDRLLWHQLGLQVNCHVPEMLTEDEYVATVCGFYPDALENNVRAYRSYFNNKHDSLGFREIEMPIPVDFAEGRNVST